MPACPEFGVEATMSIATVPITPEDLLLMPDEAQGYELVDGELREMNVSTESSRVSGIVYFELQSHAVASQPAWVFPEGTSFRCFPDDPMRVRRADTSVISLSRMPVGMYEDEGHCTTVPDLVAEVVSPNDLSHEVEEKRDQWLDAGVKVVWIIHPNTKTIHVHRADGSYSFLKEADTLTADGVLPGFSVPVARLFKKPGE
jgi:Uma2 family endonuclease